MSRHRTAGLRRPGVPLLWVLVVVLVLAAGLAAGWAAWPRFGPVAQTGGARQALEGTLTASLPAPRAVAVEQAWVAAAFPVTYLVSPPGPLPCPDGVREESAEVRRRVDRALGLWRRGEQDAAVEALSRGTLDSFLPATTLGMMLAQKGDVALAQQVLRDYLRQPAIERAIQEQYEATRRERTSLRLSSQMIRGLIYALHTRTRLQLEARQPEAGLITDLRRPIGLAAQLSLRQELTDIRSMPTWSELAIAAPGCTASAGALTTYDLYNDLLVAYLTTPDFHDDGLDGELKREYRDPPAANPLLAVLDAARQNLVPNEEHRVWALSNAERILRWSPQPPGDARLSYNLAVLLESVLELAPADAREALLARRQQLWTAAAERRAQVPDPDRQRLVQGLLRLDLLAASREGRLPAESELAKALLAEAPLDTKGRQTLEHLRAAIALRTGRGDAAATPLLAVLADEDGADEALAKLGEGAEAWRTALRRDASAAVARQVLANLESQAGQGATEARQAAAFARALARGEAPPELEELEARLGWRSRLHTPAGRWGRAAVAVLAGLVAAFLVYRAGRWAVVQLRRRRDLLTSFYRLETEALRRAERRRRGR